MREALARYAAGACMTGRIALCLRARQRAVTRGAAPDAVWKQGPCRAENNSVCMHRCTG